ncbi:MAG: hypothetical protein ACI86S_001901, partial [Paracoccaceae bacterium]
GIHISSTCSWASFQGDRFKADKKPASDIVTSRQVGLGYDQ